MNNLEPFLWQTPPISLVRYISAKLKSLKLIALLEITWILVFNTLNGVAAAAAVVV